MSPKKIALIILIIALCTGGLITQYLTSQKDSTLETGTENLPQTQKELPKQPKPIEETSRFSRFGLQTDSSIHSIPLDEILSGGPGKDGIPAIHEPLFISIQDASVKEYITQESLGISVEDGSSAKFYPYSIMNWHEIVTDTVNDIPVSVTFCPLCGSAIVFDRRVNDEVLTFGVSGMLRESNLLMYDTKTESLRSQALGKGVVGAFTDTILNRMSSDVMSFEQFVANYPDGQVLSDETGYARSYTNSPYGDYDSNDTLYFPVNNEDATLPKKEMLYIINDGETSVAFVKETLIDAGEKQISIEGTTYTALFDAGRVTVTTDDGRKIPGHHEMWFSWATHNPNSKNIVQ